MYDKNKSIHIIFVCQNNILAKPVILSQNKENGVGENITIKKGKSIHAICLSSKRKLIVGEYGTGNNTRRSRLSRITFFTRNPRNMRRHLESRPMLA